MNPLNGCWAKIERAKHYLERLEATMRDAGRDNLYGITAETDDQTRERIVRFKFLPELSVEWGIDTGEIIHHLRSSLEHLVWQLIIVGGSTPKEGKAGFPVCHDQGKYQKTSPGGGQPKIQGIPNGADAIIERLQPYRQSDYRSDPLWVLNELWNIDKHRRLNVVALNLMGYKAILPQGRSIVRGPFGVLEDSAEIYRFILPPDVTPGVNMTETFLCNIALHEPGLGKPKALIPTLKKLVKFVESVVGSFVRFLPTL